jgi:type IV secretory pathway TraG/TraD family ATPase VirD4
MIFGFIWLFTALSLIMLPAMLIFQSQDGLEGTYNYAKAQYSLGNMGFSSSLCLHQYVDLNIAMTFSCTTGTIESL